MRELAEISRQANQLVVFDRGSAVVIAQQEAPGYWGISIRVGSHISLFDTGSGHVLLAFRSQEERQMMISEHLRSTEKPEQPPEFFSRLDQIRDRGYEMMASMQTAGVYNLSAPVLGPDGKAIAALTVPYITLVNLPSAPDITQTIELLLTTAEKLSRLAGSDVKQIALISRLNGQFFRGRVRWPIGRTAHDHRHASAHRGPVGACATPGLRVSRRSTAIFPMRTMRARRSAAESPTALHMEVDVDPGRYRGRDRLCGRQGAAGRQPPARRHRLLPPGGARGSLPISSGSRPIPS